MQMYKQKEKKSNDLEHAVIQVIVNFLGFRKNNHGKPTYFI